MTLKLKIQEKSSLWSKSQLKARDLLRVKKGLKKVQKPYKLWAFYSFSINKRFLFYRDFY
jgi:hypothetical protein